MKSEEEFKEWGIEKPNS